MTEYDKNSFKLIAEFPTYEIGDIICIRSTGAHWLLEDIVGRRLFEDIVVWEYCFRILDNNTTRRESVPYIDGHNDIIKVA